MKTSIEKRLEEIEQKINALTPPEPSPIKPGESDLDYLIRSIRSGTFDIERDVAGSWGDSSSGLS